MPRQTDDELDILLEMLELLIDNAREDVSPDSPEAGYIDFHERLFAAIDELTAWRGMHPEAAVVRFYDTPYGPQVEQ